MNEFEKSVLRRTRVPVAVDDAAPGGEPVREGVGNDAERSVFLVLDSNGAGRDGEHVAAPEQGRGEQQG